jgi:hypothetical protein
MEELNFLRETYLSIKRSESEEKEMKRLEKIKNIDINEIFQNACAIGDIETVENIFRPTRNKRSKNNKRKILNNISNGLLISTIKENVKIIEKILEKGKKYIETIDLEYAFLIACENGNIQLVKRFNDIIIKDSNRKIIRDGIICACRYGHLETAEELIKEIKKEERFCDFVEIIIKHALYTVCFYNKSVKNTLEFINNNYNNNNLNHCLRGLCEGSGNLQIVKKIINMNDKHDYNELNYCTDLAIENNYMRIAEELIKIGGYPRDFDYWKRYYWEWKPDQIKIIFNKIFININDRIISIIIGYL